MTIYYSEIARLLFIDFYILAVDSKKFKLPPRESSLTHFRPMFHLCRNQVVGFYQQNVWKTLLEEWNFASKNQLPGLFVSGTLVENGLLKHDEIKKLNRMRKSFPLELFD